MYLLAGFGSDGSLKHKLRPAIALAPSRRFEEST